MMYLRKCNSSTADFSMTSSMLAELRGFLDKPFDPNDRRIAQQLEIIARFQSSDGSFKLMEDGNIPHDAYVDFCTYPTVLCSAILMKAILCFPEEYSSYLPVLGRALDSVVKMGLGGDGYDYLDVQLDFMKLYCDAGLIFFLDRYPELSSDFSNAIDSIRNEYRRYINENSFIHGFGNNYEDGIRETSRLLEQHRIFVYGTLMSGEWNHRYIEAQLFEGEGSINGFNLYEHEGCPGIRHSNHFERVVHGEIYSVDSDSFEAVDQFETESSHYALECIDVQLGERCVVAGVYVLKVICQKKKRVVTGFWKLPRIYIAYGSNMNRAQMFSRYSAARLLGSSILENCALLFKKNIHGNTYATIASAPSSEVPVVLWAIDRKGEQILDRFEGYHEGNPSRSSYIKRNRKIDFQKDKVSAFSYVMANERDGGRPEYEYYNRILIGYIENGIDPRPLIQSVEK